MDHHVAATQLGADVETLIHPFLDDGPHIGVVGRDGEAPERAVDAHPPGIARQKLLGPRGGRAPFGAVQGLAPNEILQLQVALSVDNPTGQVLKHADRHSGAQDGKALRQLGTHRTLQI